MGYSRQEYWSELPFLPSVDLPNPGIKNLSLLGLLHLQVGSSLLAPPGRPHVMYLLFHNKNNLKERKEGGREEKAQRQCMMTLVVSVNLRRPALTTWLLASGGAHVDTPCSPSLPGSA